MAKLTEKEREGFERILADDLKAINTRFLNQIKDFWGVARIEVLKTKGWDKLLQEKEDLKNKERDIRNRIHEIEEILNDEHLRAEQAVELGGKTNDRGRVEGANFYGIPVTSQFEYEIVEFIRKNIDIEVPAKILRDICESSIRELTMAGTFEEARRAYEKFYSLDFRSYGVDIPPRLDEICGDKKLLQYAQQPLKQVGDGKTVPEIKKLTDAREGTSYIH